MRSMHRNALILAAAGLAALATSTAMPSTAAASGSGPVVATALGKVQGQATGEVYSFLGLHYGADTGGRNRFLPPQPAASWTGVKPATAMGDRCPQPPLNKVGNPLQVIQFSDAPTSEDCLVLNVWTPHPGAGKRPVMVWLHGGGFAFGSANDKYYDGTNLAHSQDVVVVSLNHRLNVFGYLDLGPDAGPQYAASGDAGMLDIVQALQWVKANIAAFGGDPSNVTVFGQSGGGGKVSTLLGMPSAHGLFSKAIIESGSNLRAQTPEEAIAVRDRVLGALNLKPAEVGKLRDLPMQDLVMAAVKAGLLSYHPELDGHVIPVHMFDPAATPISADVPLMLGTAHDEATDVLVADPAWPQTSEAALEAKAAFFLGGPDRAKAAIALYKARQPDDKPSQILASIVTDQMFTRNAIALADRKSVQAAPVYAYRIQWRTPVLDGVLRSPHGVELPFVFDNVAVAPELVGSGESQERMAKLMSSSFAAFARTGNPDVKGAPHWPAYDATRRPVFIFDIPPKVVSDPDPAIRSFLEAK